MPTFARRPSTTSSPLPADIPQNSMVGQQRQQISELQFDKIPFPQSFFGVEDTIQKSSDYQFWFSIGCYVVDHRSRDVNSLDELKSSRSVCREDFPNFGMLDAKIASARNKIIQNSQFKKKVSLEEQKAQKEDRFLRGRQITFIIYDYLRVTGAHDTALDYADLFSVALHDDNVQEFDTRWDEVQLSMSKIPSDVVLESLYKLRIREFAQLKTVLELYDMEFHQKISIPNYQKLKTMVKKEKRSEIAITKLWRQVRENWNRSSGQESKGTKRRWRRKRYLLSVERKRPVFERRPVQFPAWE